MKKEIDKMFDKIIDSLKPAKVSNGWVNFSLIIADLQDWKELIGKEMERFNAVKKHYNLTEETIDFILKVEV